MDIHSSSPPPTAARGEDVKSGNDTEYLFQLDVIGTEADDGSRVLHVRWRDKITLDPVFEIGTIFLLFLEPEGINTTAVKDSLISFFNIINVPINIYIPQPGDSLDYYNEVNAVAFFGEGSKVLRYAADVYGRISKNITDIHSDFWKFSMPSSDVPEIALPLHYCFIRTNNEDDDGESCNDRWAKDFRCSNFDHFLSFACFHSLGHCAGITHIEGDYGYMAPGGNIPIILSENWDTGAEPDRIIKELGENEQLTIIDLVKYTKNTFPEMIEVIFNRYHRIGIE